MDKYIHNILFSFALYLHTDGQTLENLKKNLKFVENLIKIDRGISLNKNVEEDINFRFGADGGSIWTIGDIIETLELSGRDNNRKFLVEGMEMVVKGEIDLQVYYS